MALKTERSEVDTTIQPDGMQKDYLVLSEEECAKDFIRPYRDTYTHDICGVATIMSRALSETYAINPWHYSGTFCSGCGAHFPVGEHGEFHWNDGTKVGT